MRNYEVTAHLKVKVKLLLTRDELENIDDILSNMDYTFSAVVDKNERVIDTEIYEQEVTKTEKI